jgi:hypothetical protein
MTDVTSDATTASPAASTDSTLLTAAPAAEVAVATGELGTSDARKPDQGEGEKTPDKGDGDKAPAGEDETAGAEPAPGAPQEYADFSAPDGVTLNADLLAAFKEAAKADNLPQEKAQQYVDLGAKILQQQAQAQADAILAIRGEWKAASESQFGSEQLAAARAGLDAYGTPALAELLDQSGLGNHPEIIRLLVNAGASAREDKLVSGREPAAKPASLAGRLYPEQAA